MTQFNKVLQQISQNNVRNIAKYQLIELFNCRFYNQEYYQEHTPGIMLLDYETNRENKDFIFEDVLDFCMKTDVCKSLNMSFVELFTTLDYATYMKLKEVILKDNERKAIALEKSRKESELRTQQLTGRS